MWPDRVSNLGSLALESDMLPTVLRGLAEVNLIEFHTMVKHNEKVCQAQNLGSHNQGQGHSLRL